MVFTYVLPFLIECYKKTNECSTFCCTNREKEVILDIEIFCTTNESIKK